MLTDMHHRPVPARVVLAPHRPLLSRGGSARQFGLDPEAAPAAEDLPPPLLGLLERLAAPTAVLDWVAEAVARGVAVDTAKALLEGLVAHGALVDAGAAGRRASRRAAAFVEVRGDGPLAAGVAVALARAGVGGVRVRARGSVSRADLGCGDRDSDVGSAREAAAAAAVSRVAGATRTAAPPPGRRPDLVVLTDAVAPEPEVLDGLLGEGIDHLTVMVRDGTGVVGPLALVRRSTCLRCVELGRAECDPQWPALAAQLAGRSGSADPEVVAATAALGAAQALLALDGGSGREGAGDGPGTEPPTVGGALELDPYAGTLRRRTWRPHPDCPCGVWAAQAAAGPLPRCPRGTDTPVTEAVPEATCAGHPGRATITG